MKALLVAPTSSATLKINRQMLITKRVVKSNVPCTNWNLPKNLSKSEAMILLIGMAKRIAAAQSQKLSVNAVVVRKSIPFGTFPKKTLKKCCIFEKSSK